MTLPRLTKEQTIELIKFYLEDGWSLYIAKSRAFVRPKYEREVLNKDPEYIKIAAPYRKTLPRNPKRKGMDTTLVKQLVSPSQSSDILPIGINQYAKS